jgi:hypothetical protein
VVFILENTPSPCLGGRNISLYSEKGEEKKAENIKGKSRKGKEKRI